MFRNRNLGRFFSALIKEPDQRRLVYFLSLLVGFLSALAAALLKNAVHYTHIFLTEKTISLTGSYLYLVFPVAGILVTYLFIKYVVGESVSHGISRVLYAISKKKGVLRIHNTWSSLVASTLTIGFGGSVGAEAPIVLTGSAIGSALGRSFRLNYQMVKLLIGCGAAGAIAGIFKAPIAGIVFTLEVLMLDLTIASIVPLLISSVTAATIAWFLMGDKVLLSFSVNEPAAVSSVPWYLVLGIITGLVSVYFTRMTLFTEGLYRKIKNEYVRLFSGGLLLVILIFLFPAFYGEGYDALRDLLEGNVSVVFSNSFFDNASESIPLLILFGLGLVFMKVIASSSTNGSGGVGGIFAPTLFVGGVTGFIMSVVLREYAGIDYADSRYILAGMAGMMAGVMHAPLTAIFLIAELTGGYALLIPLILTSTVSYITTRAFQKHSIYHLELANRGELLTHDKDKAALLLMNWKKEIETDLKTVQSKNTLGDLVKVIAKSKRNIYPVVDEYKILEGVVMLDDVREIMFNNEKYESVTVRELMSIPPSYIDISESIDTVMDTFEKTGAWNLPVLNNGYYVGFLSKSRIYSTYREKLIEFSEE